MKHRGLITVLVMLMSELSQAEREQTLERELREAGERFQTLHHCLEEDPRYITLKERERALEEALKTARRRIRQMHEAGSYSSRKEIVTDAICEIDDALAASQPEVLSERCPDCVEGHTHDVCDGEPVVAVCGSCHGTGKLDENDAQPVHGPGEPAFPGVLTMANRQDLCRREGHIPCVDSPRCRRCYVRLWSTGG